MTVTLGQLCTLVHDQRTDTLTAARDWRPRTLAVVLTDEQWNELTTDPAMFGVILNAAHTSDDALLPLVVFDVPVWITHSTKLKTPCIVEHGRIPITARPAKV